MLLYAPLLPSYAIPLVLLVYALPATVGSMYGIVVKRFHDQLKYNEEGMASKYNRRWTGWMAAFFALSLVSATMFLLDAPAWDSTQWFFIGFAAVIYLAIFLVMKRKSRRLYSQTYFKSRAIAWTSLFVTAALALLYVITTMGSSPGNPGDLLEAIEARSMPFADSPCSLLVEADKLNSFSNCLVEYGLNCVEESTLAVVLLIFAIKIALNASMFFGIASLLSVCTLSLPEMASVFCLLPGRDGCVAGRSPDKMHVIAPVVVLLVFTALFVAIDEAAEKEKEAGRETAIDSILDEASKWLDILPTIPDTMAVKSVYDAYRGDVDALASEYEDDLRRQIEEYYEGCASNVDSYLEWRGSIVGGFARTFGFIGEGMAGDEFCSRVSNPVDESDLCEAYGAYAGELKLLRERLLLDMQELGFDLPSLVPATRFGVDAELELWPSWDSEEGSRIASDVLLKSSEENAAADIAAFIGERRDEAISALESAKEDSSELMRFLDQLFDVDQRMQEDQSA